MLPMSPEGLGVWVPIIDPIAGANIAKAATPITTAAAKASRIGTRQSIRKSFQPALYVANNEENRSPSVNGPGGAVGWFGGVGAADCGMDQVTTVILSTRIVRA